MVRYHEIDPFRWTCSVASEVETGGVVRARGKQIRVGRMGQQRRRKWKWQSNFQIRHKEAAAAILLGDRPGPPLIPIFDQFQSMHISALGLLQAAGSTRTTGRLKPRTKSELFKRCIGGRRLSTRAQGGPGGRKISRRIYWGIWMNSVAKPLESWGGE
jgi:hypothetical protein